MSTEGGLEFREKGALLNLAGFLQLCPGERERVSGSQQEDVYQDCLAPFSNLCVPTMCHSV